MKIFTVAPIRINFSLNKSETAFNSNNFFKFWNIAKNINHNFEEVKYYKLFKNISLYDDNSYDKLDKNEQKNFGIVFTNDINKYISHTENENIKFFFSKFIHNIEYFELQFYDNTIGIVDLKLNLVNINTKDHNEFTDKIEFL